MKLRTSMVAQIIAFTGLAFVAGCASSDRNGVAPGGRDSGKVPTADARPPQPDARVSNDSGVPTACTASPAGPSPGAVCVLSVSGRAVDENDQPVTVDTAVSACGAAQCNPGITDASGAFQIGVGFRIVPTDYSVQVHVRPDWTAFYFQLPSGTTEHIQVGNLRALRMPDSGPPLVIDRNGAPAQSVTSGEVTLEVPDGFYVRLDVESNLAADKGKQFRALRIPDEFLNEFSAGTTGVKAMYALEPFECQFERAGQSDVPLDIRLSFDNSVTGLAAGAAVELLALGTYVYPDWIAPATFQVVAKAHVSADGSRIDLDAGEGLPYLTWVLLRLAP